MVVYITNLKIELIDTTCLGGEREYSRCESIISYKICTENGEIEGQLTTTKVPESVLDVLKEIVVQQLQEVLG